MDLIVNKSYPFKVWASTILTAPVILAIWEIVLTGSGSGASGVAFYVIFFSAMFSLPSFLACYFAFILLAKRVRTAFRLKLVFTCMAMFCLFASFFLLFGSGSFSMFMNNAGITFSCIYAVPIVVFGLLFNAAKEHNPEDDFLKDFNTKE